MARVLVTGATGLLGNNLVRRMCELDHDVHVLVRAGGDPRPLAGLNVTVFEGDIRDELAVERAAAGVQTVVHCAGVVRIGWSGSELFEAVNVQGTRHVIHACRRAGARLLHVSSVNAMGFGTWNRPADEDQVAGENVACPYVLTKRRSEELVFEAARQSLDAVVVNPSYMLGPWDWKPSSSVMLLQVARRFTPFAPWGGISVCDVRDVTEAILTAIERAPSGRRYVLAGENIGYLRLWRLMADVCKASGPLIPAGPLMRIIAGRFGDLWGYVTGDEPEINSAAVRMSDVPHYFSSQRAIAEIGYHNRPLRTTLEDAWAWLQEHGYVSR